MRFAKRLRMYNGIRLLAAFLLATLGISAFLPVTALAVERYQVLQNGDKDYGDDNYVARLQAELHARGYLESEPTGYFGKETEEALWNYQARKDLKADGKAGPETQEAIFGKWYEPIPESRQMGEGSSSGSSGSSESSGSSGGSSSGSGKRYAVMMYGDKDYGDDNYVKRLQEELVARGYMETAPTGYFGKETQAAVARYQERKGLTSDGKAGPETQKTIFGSHYEAIPESRKVVDSGEDRGTSSASSSSSTDPNSLRNGDEGASVKEMQKRLKELGFYTYRKNTNYFGDITEEAVIKFQEQNGLTADGVAGKRTLERLFSSKAKEYSKSKDSGSSSSSSKKSDGIKKQSTDGKASAKNITITAQELLGKKYRTGGTGPNTFDCSGFVYYVLKSYGLSTPRSSREMSEYSKWGMIDSKGDLVAGDLVFFKSPGSGSGVGHVGIYLGGGEFIHSSSGSAKSVTISSMSGYYSDKFKWGRRIFD